MINYVQLFINDPATTELDLSNEFQINLQYSIADIRDISKRNTSFSKTILLPGTKRNNTVLGNLYDPNADFTQFNPNIKTQCSLIVNSEVVIKGFLQLKNIKKLNNTDQSGNLIYWEVVIFNNTVDLMTELGEKTMDDVDLLQLTHEYTTSNIISSWTRDWTNGWVYPMYGIEGQPSTYKVTDFYPAYYSKFLLSSILSESGFGWTGSLATNTQFEREIIPFVGSGSQSIGPDTIELRNLRVGITQSYTIASTHSVNNGILLMNNTGFQNPTINVGAGTTDALGPGNVQWRFTEDNFTYPFALDLFDNNGDFDTSTSIWTTSRTRKWSPIWRVNYDYVIQNTSTLKMWSFAPNHDQFIINAVGYPVSIPQNKAWNYPWFDFIHTLEYEGFTQIFGITFSTWIPWDVVTVTKQMQTGGPGPTVSNGNRAGQWDPGASFSVNVNFTRNSNELVLPTGTRVRLKVKVIPSENLPEDQFTYVLGNQTTGTFSHYAPNLGPLRFSFRKPGGGVDYSTSNLLRTELTPRVSTSESLNTFYNNGVSFAVQEGDDIFARDFLGTKLKQKDFLFDLIKRYNLYIQIDPNNERQLIIDTRADFYKKNLQLDWTQKKDLLTEDKWTILSELQFKEVLFTMTPDDDFYNKDYRAAVGDIYGQYKWIFANEFVKNVQTIQSPFSPTPLVKTPFGAITPALSTDDPSVKTRVLYWGGLKPGVGNLQWKLQGAQTSFTFNTYPYAGHFDDPINPQLDIHFGTPKYLYYNNVTTMPLRTMFETYWKDWIDQIEEGRMLTAKFYLDEIDIKTIRDNFWAKIWIFDSWYYVNKIIDYKPIESGLTTVELLKIRDGINIEIVDEVPVRAPWQLVKDLSPVGALPSGIANVAQPGSGLVVGDSNTIGGVKVNSDGLTEVNRNLVVGNNNNVKSYNSIALGDSNTVVSSWGYVIGGEGVNIIADDIIVLGNREGRDFEEASKAYIGESIEADFINKASQYDRFTKGVNLSVEGINLGQSDWRTIPEWKEVTLQSSKQTKVREMMILGHLETEASATYSFGDSVRRENSLLEITEQLNIKGLLSVGGEVFVGEEPVNSDLGVMFLKDNSIATPISVSGERQVVAGNIQTGILSNFIKDERTNSLKYIGARGRFHVIATFNFTDGNQRTCGFYIGHNKNQNTALDPNANRISESEIYVNSGNPTSQPVSGSIQTVLDLKRNDRVFFIVQNIDSADDITVPFMKLIIAPIK